MDVYTTSFNVYPFAVPPTSAYPSQTQPPAFSQQQASNFTSGNGGLSPYGAGSGNHQLPTGIPVPQLAQQQAYGNLPHSHPPPPVSAPTTQTTANSAVHRHHSTLSGVEVVWDQLHRLTLQAMAQYPGTHISFSRTASSASSSLSEDSLALMGIGASNPGANGSQPMLAGHSHSSGNGGGVISANANAALLTGPHTRGTAFNVTITGSSQANVMAARGLILRDSPVQNRSVIKVARSEILEPSVGRPPAQSSNGGGSPNGDHGNMISSVPMPGTSPGAPGQSTGGALKQPVIQRLDEIAAQTRANISVLKTSSSSPSPSSASSAYPHSPYSSSPYPSSTWSNNYGATSTSSFTSWPSFPASGSGGNASNSGGGGGGNFGGANTAAQAAGLEGEKTCELIITGPGDTVDVARLRLLVMLDELSGLHAEQVDIDYKLHGILAGRRRRSVQQIQEETGTNIYFPPLPLRAPSQPSSNNAANPPNSSHVGTPPSGLSADIASSSAPMGHSTSSSRQGSASPPDPSGVNGTSTAAALGYNPNIIWITGEFFNVGRARDALYQLAAHKSKTIISRDTAILSRKLDWMLTHRLDDIKSIQRDNGTYITFPPIGSGTTVCTIYGDSRIAIERTVRAVMLLASQFYIACIWLLPLHYNVLVPSANGVNPAAMGGHVTYDAINSVLQS